MTAQREQEEVDIRRRIDSLVAAIQAKDLDGLGALCATDVVSFDVEPPLQRVGVAAKQENWSRAFAVFQEVTYQLRDLVVTVGGDVAIGHGFGRLGGTLNNGDVTSGMWVRATFCLRKVDGNWLIAHDHVSVPFDLRTGKGVTGLEP